MPFCRREASLAIRPTGGEALESERLKARLGEILLERELLEAKIAALEARDPCLLPRRWSRRSGPSSPAARSTAKATARSGPGCALPGCVHPSTVFCG